MSSTPKPTPEPPKARPIPEGFPTVTPYLLVKQPAPLADFVKWAFGGVEVFSAKGGLHTHIRLGDSIVMIDGAPSMPYDETPAALHFYVPDIDAVYRRAVEAGATPIAPPADHDYGERGASLKDAHGNLWYLATPLSGQVVREGFRSVTPYLHPRSAGKMIEFLKQAFEAKEVARYTDADGRVAHAEVQIGDSMVEMGEPRGSYQPMPAAIYLYVEDVDATYRRALQAGATSVQTPEDKPYGDRNAGVKDAFGHTWWLATHLRDW
ncbi:MAG TPA: VOC family protein [Terriglobia bacterium]|nr:VOC family protein [Terriglobia bacterium]